MSIMRLTILFRLMKLTIGLTENRKILKLFTFSLLFLIVLFSVLVNDLLFSLLLLVIIPFLIVQKMFPTQRNPVFGKTVGVDRFWRQSL